MSKTGMKINFLVNIVLILLFVQAQVIHCLYQDQVGKWDWRHRYVGQISSVIPFHLSSSPSIIVSTSKNVVSSLSIRNGSLHWRQILEDRLSGPPAIGIDLISSSDDSGGLTEVITVPEVVTISGYGRYVRKWSAQTGLLLSEFNLPDDLVDGANDGSHQLLFNVDWLSNEIVVVKNNVNSLQILKFDLRTVKQKDNPSSVPLGDLMLDMNECSFASNNYVVCINSKNATIWSISLKNSAKVETSPLISFGLKSDTSSQEELEIITFDLQKKAESPVFAVDLGGKNGFVIFKIVQGEVKLVKILAKVSKVALAALNLPHDSEPQKLGLFALIAKPADLPHENADERPFKVAAFDLENWSDLKSLNGQFVIHSSSPSIVDRFYIIPFLKPDQELKHYKILVTCTDEQVSLISPQGKVSWVREEALSSIITTQFIDFPLSELDTSIEQAFGSSSSIINQFTARISSQVTQLQTIVLRLADDIQDLISPSPPVPNLSADFGVFSDSQKQKTRDYFGLNKIILVLTEAGKVFGLDSSTGAILWSFYDEDLQEHELSHKQISIHILRTSAHYPHSAVALIVTKQGLILSFDPITGSVLEKTKFKEGLKQSLLLSHHDETHLKSLIALTESDKVYIYPKSSWNFFLTIKNKYYVMVGYPASGLLVGYDFRGVTSEGSMAQQIWSLDFPLTACSDCTGSQMNILFKKQNEQVHSQGRVLGDRNVMYKYLNPNVAVVVIEGEDSSLTTDSLSKKAHLFNLHLIDAVSGRILYSANHKRCRGPVHVVHSENSIIYSYFNEKARRTEISAIDLYEGLSPNNSTAFSSLDLRTPLVEHSTFIFPTGIRAMIDTHTEKGITNKHIIISLPSGGILELPKAFLDPRRPITPTMEHREEGLIPYIPELPIPSEGLINYNKSVHMIQGIEVSPSGLESTCLVFSYGLDIFFTRVTPSKTFDILKDDFDHLLIAGVVVLMIAFAFITKWMAARKLLKAAWT